MENFSFHCQTELIFGKDTQKLVGEKIREYGGKKILLHYGGGSIKRTGLYDEVVASLRGAGLSFIELGGVQPNPRLTLVREGIALCRREGVDFILAVGGGSVIDSAKAMAVGIGYEGDVWDFYAGKAQAQTFVPVATVLTIPAAGSESSKNSVITNEETLIKKGYGNEKNRPVFSILNPELTYTLPFYQTACGISDMLAHVMERYFTQTPEVDVTDRMCEGVMRSIMNIAPRVKTAPKDYDARAELMWASTIAHNDILSCGRVGDWGSHGIEHQLSAVYDLAHGAGLSIIFPAWMKYVYRENKNRFLQFALRVMDVELAMEKTDANILEAIARLERFYQSLDLPIRLREVGIDDTHFAEMAGRAAPLGQFKRLQARDIEEIYRLAL